MVFIFFQAPIVLVNLWLIPNSSILQTVLSYLDNKSLANFRLVNKTWHSCISNEKILWKRIISEKVMNESNSVGWKQLLKKIPLYIVKEIGEGLIEFRSDYERRYNLVPYNLYNYFRDTPLHTTARLGLLRASKYIGRVHVKKPVPKTSGLNR